MHESASTIRRVRIESYQVAIYPVELTADVFVYQVPGIRYTAVLLSSQF